MRAYLAYKVNCSSNISVFTLFNLVCHLLIRTIYMEHLVDSMQTNHRFNAAAYRRPADCASCLEFYTITIAPGSNERSFSPSCEKPRSINPKLRLFTKPFLT